MRTFPAFIISVAIHLWLYWWLTGRAAEPPTAGRAKTVELSVVSRQKRQLAPRRLARPETEAHPNKNAADFLSDHTQRVLHQTVAPQTGALSRAPSQKRAKSSTNSLHLFPSAAPNAVDFNTPHSPPSLMRSASPRHELLNPQLKLGQVTALNTDSHLYYSFLSRVSEQITQPWVQMVTFAARRHLNPPPVERRQWITQVEVILDQQGHYEDVYLLKKSGLPAFDQAALQAFRQGLIYPHPPKGLIDEDTGKVHLQYAFHVIWDLLE